jgi:hypothetical protein
MHLQAPTPPPSLRGQVPSPGVILRSPEDLSVLTLKTRLRLAICDTDKPGLAPSVVLAPSPTTVKGPGDTDVSVVAGLLDFTTLLS